jgi:hypothetical protein
MALRAPALLALVAALPLACSQEEPLETSIQASAADLASLGRLVPEDAVAIVATPSLASMDAAFAEMARHFENERFVLSDRLEGLPGWPGADFVTSSMPLAVTIGPIMGLVPPSMTFILPVTDVEAVRRRLAGMTVHADGGYVGISLDAGYTPGGSASELASALPEGQLVMRADPHGLLGPLRPTAELMAPMVMSGQQVSFGGMDPAIMGEVYVKLVFDLLEGMERVEGSLTATDGRVVVNGLADVRAGSILADIPPATCDSLDEMMGWMEDDSGIQMVAAVDARAFAELSSRLMLESMDIYPAASEDDLMEYLATLQVLSARCGHVFAADGDFSPGGMEFSYLIEAQDPNGTVDSMTAFMREGFEFLGGRTAEVETLLEDGWATANLSVDMNEFLESMSETGGAEQSAAMNEMFKEMYGGDGVIRYKAQAADGRIMLSTGGAAERTPDSQGDGAPQDVVAALARIEDADTRLVMRLDYARLMSSMTAMLSSMPGMEDISMSSTGPVPLTMWLGGKGTSWTFGTDFDLGAFARMMKSMTR